MEKRFPGWMDEAARWVRPETVLCMAAGWAAAFYLLHLPYGYVGSFNDDGTYVMAAQSLAQGRYVSLNDPQTPPLTQFPPGYPLFLMPFVHVASPPWTLLKFTSIGLILVSLPLLWFLLEGALSPWFRCLLCALVALNPQTLRLSSAVMSEPLYLCLSLFTFLMLRRSLEKDSPSWVPWVLGLAAGGAGLVRTVGIVLIPALGVCLAYARRGRVGIRAIPVAVLPALLFYIANLHQTGHLTVHTGLLQSMWTQLHTDGIGMWLDHLHRSGYLFFVRGFLGWSLPYTEWGGVVSLGLSVFLLVSAGLGARRLLREKSFPRPLTMAILLYVVGYLCIFAFWTVLDSRFVLPLLPFLALFILRDWQDASSRVAYPRLMKALVVMMVMGVYVGQDAFALYDMPAQQRKDLNPFPGQSFQWIQENTSPDSYILYGRPSVLYLYTHRYSCSSLVAENVEEFRYSVLSRGITHTLYQPIVGKGTRGYNPAIWHNQTWIAGWPTAFQRVYSNPAEHVLLYKVIPDRAYQNAYARFLAAKTRGGLEDVLKHYPQIANAQNAYGELLVTQKNDASAGERYFKKALAIRPYYPRALLNLARVYQKKGEHALARQTYEKALEAIPIAEESSSLAPQIQKEMVLLP